MLRDVVVYIYLRGKDWFFETKKKGGFTHLFQKAAVLLALVLWVITAANILISSWNFMGKEQIISAFNNEAYTSMTAGISTFGKYGNFNLTDNAKKIILEDIAKEIGIDKYTIEDTTEEGNSVKTLSQSSVNGDVICKFITTGEIPQAECCQYIYIGITLKSSVDAAFSYEKVVRDVVKKLNMNTTVTVNLKGEMEGRLGSGMRDMIADSMLNRMKAKIVAENRDDALYTIYAYDDNINEYIQMGKAKVNVNLSISYDEERDVTSVYLSTPMNNQDY